MERPQSGGEGHEAHADQKELGSSLRRLCFRGGRLVGPLRIHEGRGRGGVGGGQSVRSGEYGCRGTRVQKHAQRRRRQPQRRDANHVGRRWHRKLRLGVHAHADVPDVRRQERIQGQGT